MGRVNRSSAASIRGVTTFGAAPPRSGTPLRARGVWPEPHKILDFPHADSRYCASTPDFIWREKHTRTVAFLHIPQIPTKSRCIPPNPKAMMQSRKRRTGNIRTSRHPSSRSVPGDTKRQDGRLHTGTRLTRRQNPARERADIPPGGARSRTSRRRDEGGGLCSGSSTIRRFRFQDTTSGRGRERPVRRGRQQHQLHGRIPPADRRQGACLDPRSGAPRA